MGVRPRRLESITREALASFRVVVVTGPRQAGKTTLVRRTLGGAGTFAPPSTTKPLCRLRRFPVGDLSGGAVGERSGYSTPRGTVLRMTVPLWVTTV